MSVGSFCHGRIFHHSPHEQSIFVVLIISLLLISVLQEYQERQAKQAAALKKYKEKKFARHKKLSRKTPRGQPVMRYQIEHLLDKLKNE